MTHQSRFTRFFLAAVMLFMLTALAGCGTYTLEGRVIQGGFSDATVVPSGDAAVEGEGIGRVRVVVERDPNSPRQARVADFIVSPNGYFSVPINAFGTGWMNEVWKVQAIRDGYTSVLVITQLPRDEQQLLITLAPGQATPLEEREDLMDQYRTFR